MKDECVMQEAPCRIVSLSSTAQLWVLGARDYVDALLNIRTWKTYKNSSWLPDGTNHRCCPQLSLSWWQVMSAINNNCQTKHLPWQIYSFSQGREEGIMLEISERKSGKSLELWALGNAGLLISILMTSISRIESILLGELMARLNWAISCGLRSWARGELLAVWSLFPDCKGINIIIMLPS